MSLKPHACPGCMYGGSHLEGCPNGRHPMAVDIPEGAFNKSIELPKPECNCDKPNNLHARSCPAAVPGVDVPHFITGTTVATVESPKEFITEHKLAPERVMIEQKIVPSSGTKLVCTSCGRADWHFLMLRRRAGLLEGLCKQMDGSGCYPISSRRNCSYTYPEGFDCPKLAEYVVALGEEEHRVRQVCRDHVGEVLRQGPLYQVWPLED